MRRTRAIARGDARRWRRYRFDEYAAAGYRFTWNTFCDWFVEFAKPALAEGDSAEAAEVRAAAAHVLGMILRLLHPVDAVRHRGAVGSVSAMAQPCSLIRAPWPEPVTVPDAAAAREELDWVVRLIAEVRTVRAEMNVPPGAPAPVLLRDAAPETLARAAALDGGDPPAGARLRVAAAGWARCRRARRRRCWTRRRWCCRWPSVIDLAAERARLAKERDKAAGEARKLAQKLDNADFVRRRRRRWWRKTASGWPVRRPRSRGWRRRCK